MKISCPSCEAKYSIGDDKVQSRLAKIRCRKCGVDIVIDGRVQPPTVSVGEATAAASSTALDAAPTATASAGQSFTIDFGESDQRPMTIDEIIVAYNAGQITPETFVWADGMADWTPLGQVPEIVDALNTAASAPSAPAPQPVSVRPQVTSSVPRAAATAKTTRAQGRGGADLFGSIAHAGSEEDMAQQATHEPVMPQATTGARNESSVLFSLSALTASAKPTSSATSSMSLSAPSSASKDDSGLIDLKALTSQATDTSAAANAGGLGAPSPLGGLGAPLGGIGGLGGLGGLGSPLGGASPVSSALGAPALSDLSYPQKKSRTGLYILGGAGLVGVAVVLGLALQPAPPPPPKAEPVPLVIPKAPEPEPIKPAVTEAKPPSTGESAASASAAPVKPVAGKWKAPTKKPSGQGSSGGGDKPPTSGDSGAVKKPPASGGAGKCGCPPGDLGCAMRCAAKGG